MNQEEKLLRNYVRKKISSVLAEQERQEFQLRKIVRSILKETLDILL